MMPYDEQQTKLQINIMKQKGLHKLRHYCQMCRKQCPDENGFKCHINSDSHQRMMRICSEDPQYFVNQFSVEFEKEFFDLMKQKYFSRPILPNQVYMDLIKNLEHVHMNGTRWVKLSEFVEEMEQDGKLKIILQDNQTLIHYIDNSPQAIEKRKQEEKMKKVIKKQQNIIEDFVIQQVQKGQQVQSQQPQKIYDIIEDEPNSLNFQNITFSLNIKEKNSISSSNPLKFKENKPQIEETQYHQDKQKHNLDILLGEIKKEHRIKALFDEDEGVNTEEHPWILVGIIVKILDKNVKNGKYFNKKAVILVVEQYIATIEVQNSSKDKIRIDQSLLETVIPKLEHKVMVLKYGPYRGKIGKLESIHQDNFSGSIYFEDLDILIELPYEYFSKIDE